MELFSHLQAALETVKSSPCVLCCIPFVYTQTNHFIRNTILILTKPHTPLSPTPLLFKQHPFFLAWIPVVVGNILLRLWSMLTWLRNTIFWDISAAHSRCESPVSPHPEDAPHLLKSDLVTVEANEAHWTHVHIHECTLWHGSLSCWR